MRKILLTGAVIMASFIGKSQFTQDDLIYYIGEGPDTAVIVVDFLDATEDSCYAWGFLFDEADATTGGDALTAIAANEEKFDFALEGGFLDIISYNNHLGDGGDPNFWGIWSKTDDTDWAANEGLAEELSNGEWYGCSYTDFDPAITPGEPIAAYESAKYSMSDITFWVGTGSDSAVFVVDFVNSPNGEAVSYAWGYLFDGSTDGETMLADIDAADVNLDSETGAFLDDILFNGLEGLAADPYYWATWSGTNLSDWTTNVGIGTVVNDGDWFGCSYDAWPARRPFNPISAIDSADFTASDIPLVLAGPGGEDTVFVVLDFNEWLPGSSYAFGYAFDGGTVTAEDVLLGLELAGYYWLNFDLTGGFLNAINYDIIPEVGIGGDPNYWSTWSATNVGGWEINLGISTVLSDGDWFGCSYSAWAPATPPSLPIPGTGSGGVDEYTEGNVVIYPNPTREIVNIELASIALVQITDLQGKMVLSETYQAGINTIDLSGLESGVYFVITQENKRVKKAKLIIE